jgi:hypothetical protein
LAWQGLQDSCVCCVAAGWPAERGHRVVAVRVALRCATGPRAAAVGSRPRPLCLGAVVVDVVRGLLVPPAVLPRSLSLRARWCGPSGVSAHRVRADPAPPLAGRWLRKHATLLPCLLARSVMTPLRAGWDRSAGAFCPPSLFPLSTWPSGPLLANRLGEATVTQSTPP